MKRTIGLVASVLCLVPFFAKSQSTLEFQSGTTIEVTSGADICADVVTVNGSYSGTGTQCGGALPVELISMTCQPVKNSATLTWSTATETDNYGFEVERRSVGASAQRGDGTTGNDSRFTIHDSPQWSVLGFVKGSGTSTSPKEYSLTDENLSSGRYAYRLKQINNDGTFAYTSSFEVEIGIPEVFSLGQNYPNPFNPTTTIEYELPREVKVDLVIYDNLGRKVRALVGGLQTAGYYTVTFDAQGLSSGMYYYRIVAGDFVKVKKFLFVK